GHAEYGESPAPRVAPVPPSADPSGSPAVDPPDAGAVHLPGTAPVDQSAEALGVPQADAPDVPPADQPKRTDGLPQRVPAEPDVPALPEAVAEEVGARAETPELARIATYLRHDEHLRHDDPSAANDGIDVDAMLAAVREVPGVRDAELRRRPGRAHTLRLDLADGADPAQVSRAVARLLNERMGVSAALGDQIPQPASMPAAGPQPSDPPAAPAERPMPGDPTMRGESAMQSGPATRGKRPAPGEPPAAPPSEYRPRRLRAERARGRAAVEPWPAGDGHGGLSAL